MKESTKTVGELRSHADAIRLVETYYETKGFKKLWNYFLAIVDSDAFKLFVSDMRYKYGIPRVGFNSEEAGKVWNETDRQKNYILGKQLNKDIKKICKKFDLHWFDWGEVIDQYIKYNEIERMGYDNAYNLCLISDLAEERREPFGKDIRDSDDSAYPIAIRISPYASLRDILDYIKRLYKLQIKPMQDSYKNKNIRLGKIKAKNPLIKKRNKFIFEKKSLPRRKIKELVKEKFDITLDYEYIGKIISEEKKKRKEM
jgi:hypothetical protein